MIDFPLAKEIYGNTPWMVDPISLGSFLKILQDFRSGVNLTYDKDNKLNSLEILYVKSKAQLTFNEFQLKEAEADAELISVIKLNGPITKNGGASSFGMKQLSQRMDRMTNDKRIKGHIIDTDSGGGSSDAVIFMEDSIKRSQKAGKPVVQFIEKGGLNASAAYNIGSHSDHIMSETETNLVGSIGTMIEFEGFPQQHTEESGLVHVRAYATASVEKNHEFEEALKGNLAPVTSNILDPVNKRFIETVEKNRPNVLPRHLAGKIFEAGKVIGTLVDSIGTMDDAVNKVMELSNQTAIPSPAIEPQHTNTNLKKNTMTTQDLKLNHPDTYSSIFNSGLKSGVTAEKDRTGAWMAHAQTDLEAVKEGIKSGQDISASKREEFIVKGASLAHLENLKNDSQKGLKPPESKTKVPGDVDTEEVDAHYAKIDEKLKPSKN